MGRSTGPRRKEPLSNLKFSCLSFLWYHDWAQGGTLSPALSCHSPVQEGYTLNCLLNYKRVHFSYMSPSLLFLSSVYGLLGSHCWAQTVMWKAELELKGLSFIGLHMTLVFVWTLVTTKASARFSRATNRSNSKCVSSSASITLCLYFLHPKPISQKWEYTVFYQLFIKLLYILLQTPVLIKYVGNTSVHLLKVLCVCIHNVYLIYAAS